MEDYQLKDMRERLRDVVESYRPFLHYAAIVRACSPERKSNNTSEDSRILKTDLTGKI